MNRLIRMLAIFLITLIALVYLRDYDTRTLFQVTLRIWLYINFCRELVLSIVYKRKHDNAQGLAVDYRGVIEDRNKELHKLQDEIIEFESKLESEIDLHKKTTTRLNVLIEHDNATIKLGDRVKNMKTNQTGNVYAMKQDNGGKDGNGRLIKKIMYQLTKNGKWYSKQEIRKVE